MVKTINLIVLSLVLIVSLFSGVGSVHAAEKAMYVTSKNDLILRASPSKDAKQVSTIPKNSKVVVTSTKNEWSYITYNKKKGYVYTVALSKNPAVPPVVSNGLEPAGGLTLTYNPSFYGKSKESFRTEKNEDVTYLKTLTNGSENLAYAVWNMMDKKYFALGIAQTGFDYFNFGYPMAQNKYTERLSFTSDSNGVEVVNKHTVLVESTSKTIKTKAGTFNNTVILKDSNGFRYYLAKGYGVIKITKKDGTVHTELVAIKK